MIEFKDLSGICYPESFVMHPGRGNNRGLLVGSSSAVEDLDGNLCAPLWMDCSVSEARIPIGRPIP